jgi:hypothetical protein
VQSFVYVIVQSRALLTSRTAHTMMQPIAVGSQE